MNDNPASLFVNESILQVPFGETLSLVGGDIDIRGGVFGFMQAPDGEINITSVASTGRVDINRPHDGLESFDQLGLVELSDFAFLDTRGLTGGSIHISGGQTVVDSSTILVQSVFFPFSDTPPDSGIGIRARGDVRITNSLISTSTLRVGFETHADLASRRTSSMTEAA